MTPPLTPPALLVPVQVDDVVRARAFYAQLFEAATDPSDPSRLLLGGSRSVGILLTKDPDPEEDPLSPRLELVVVALEPWLDRALTMGCTLRGKSLDAHGSVDYAQFVDPFGHRWALMREAPA